MAESYSITPFASIYKNRNKFTLRQNNKHPVKSHKHASGNPDLTSTPGKEAVSDKPSTINKKS